MSVAITPSGSPSPYQASTPVAMDEYPGNLHIPDTPSKPPIAQIPSTLSIPSLNLPVPLQPIPQPLNKNENDNNIEHERAKAKKINVQVQVLPLPQSDESWAWGQGSIAPNSLKDLKASLGGSLNVRPNHSGFLGMGSTPRHEEMNGSRSLATELTVKAVHVNSDARDDASSYTRTLREFERDQNLLDQASDDSNHDQEVGENTPSPIVSGGIDEVQVEWCFYCKTERERTEMELIKVPLPDGDGEFDEVVRKGRKFDVDDEAGNGGWQWVCFGGCGDELDR